MNANEREYLNDLVRRVIGAAYEVSNVLGAAFLEKVMSGRLFRNFVQLGSGPSPRFRSLSCIRGNSSVSISPTF